MAGHVDKLPIGCTSLIVPRPQDHLFRRLVGF